MFLKKSILSILFIIITIACIAQIENNEEIPFKTPEDTLVLKPRHSPKKAALLSAVLPGAGQIYNQKYWKLPIVYVGLGGLGTWVGLNAINLKGYTNAYKLQLDGDSTTIGSYRGISDNIQLSVKRDQAKKSLDLSIILLSVYYALNIVDAAVDAHLFEYSITDDLSVKIQPDFNVYQANSQIKPKIGVNFGIYFHQNK